MQTPSYSPASLQRCSALTAAPLLYARLFENISTWKPKQFFKHPSPSLVMPGGILERGEMGCDRKEGQTPKERNKDIFCRVVPPHRLRQFIT